MRGENKKSDVALTESRHVRDRAIRVAVETRRLTPHDLVTLIAPPPPIPAETVRRAMVDMLYDGRLAMDDDRILRWGTDEVPHDAHSVLGADARRCEGCKGWHHWRYHAPHAVGDAYDAINECRRLVMALHGGNLDHPALDYLEAAMNAVQAVYEEQAHV